MAYNKRCDPLSNVYNVPLMPPIPGLDGFTLDINLPTLGLELPEGIPEDLLDWLRRLKFNLPGGGILQKVIENLQETIAGIISHLLAFLNMFLSMYNFIMAIVEIILCIINVLTAFKSIRKTIERIKCLIRKCFPIFINIVLPFFALLALLLNLLALLLALIEYIIALIKRLIEQLLKNIRRLRYMLRDGNSNAALAVISKLADLMCLFEHIFVLMTVIDLLLGLMESKWSKKWSCGSSGNSVLNPDDLCASFLQQPDSQTSESPEMWNLRMKGGPLASLWYCNEVYGQPFPLFPATSVSKIRGETIYLVDDSLADALKFVNLIKYKPLTETREFPMFPFDKVITEDMDVSLIPYFVNIVMTVDPNDGYGSRDFTIEDAVVIRPTRNAYLDVVAGIPIKTIDYNGYLTLSGGKTVDDPNGYNDHTIQELLKDASGFEPTTNGNGDQLQFAIKSFQVKANYEALIEYGLITIGCMPTMQLEYDNFNEVNEKAMSVIDVTLPDVGSAINGMNLCISDLKSNMNEESINKFDVCMNNILVDLSNQAAATYCQLLDASIDIYNIRLSATPEMQFVSYPIEVKAMPISNNTMTFDQLVGGFGDSMDIDSCVSNNFSATVSLGTVSKFTYDGYGGFVAEINSDIPGDGYLEVFYKGQQIPTVISPASVDTTPEVIYVPIEYTFVGYFADGYAQGVLPLPRRDEGDTSRT